MRGREEGRDMRAGRNKFAAAAMVGKPGFESAVAVVALFMWRFLNRVKKGVERDIEREREEERGGGKYRKERERKNETEKKKPRGGNLCVVGAGLGGELWRRQGQRSRQINVTCLLIHFSLTPLSSDVLFFLFFCCWRDLLSPPFLLNFFAGVSVVPSPPLSTRRLTRPPPPPVALFADFYKVFNRKKYIPLPPKAVGGYAWSTNPLLVACIDRNTRLRDA